MSDDLPTPERLGRIERGVQRRIDRRRQVARQIAGTSIAVLVLVGGVALARPLLLSSTGGSATSAGSAAGASGTAESAERAVTVVCHDSPRTRTIRIGEAHLPAAAITACAAAVGQAATAARPDAPTATPSAPPAAVLCGSPKGTLHVYLGDAATCATHGLQPYSG